jgi:septum formation protein
MKKIFVTNKPLILASGSPRRRRYFEDLGLDFTITTANIAEVQLPGENPDDFVLRMAAEKAMAVMRDHPESWVVAADTVVILDGEVLGKPRDQNDAVAMLMRLSGREHCVRTGYCIGCLAENIHAVDSAVTRVSFARYAEDVARAYVATGEPLDKAGAYGIQGRGAFLALSVSGSYANVVGLPLQEVIACLGRHGIVSPAR